MGNSRELMEFDFIIVGGGPSGLACAIKLGQLAKKNNKSFSICVLDKGAYIGAHVLAGAILEPRALTELIPNWQQKNPPLFTPVKKDEFCFLTEKKSLRLPTPLPMQNDGNFIISAGLFCQWLADQAIELGVDIFPDFAVTDLLYENDRVVGVVTGDKGIDRFGNLTSRYQPGMNLHAKQTIFAEGCRGSLTKMLTVKYNLQKDADPHTYGIGLKEIWEIPSTVHQLGLAKHTIGWPLDHQTYGGSFIYHWENNLLSIGFVVGLDYTNPYLNPYEEFQRFKTHPSIAPLLENGKRIGYGARCLNEGGFQSLPKLTFPGGLLIGDAAGFLNVPKIKGIHNAMKSGMIAAESIYATFDNKKSECNLYSEEIKKSWVWEELKAVRNIRPAMNWGLLPGVIYAALETYIFRGKIPWTFHNHADHKQLKPAAECKKINYPKHDNKITFDLMTSVFLANIFYEENQPYHLKLKDRSIAIQVNYKEFASPETRYCPAGVYEILFDENNNPRLQINGGNCLHCKACDIKDPTQNITWTPSEGGSGPRYSTM